MNYAIKTVLCFLFGCKCFITNFRGGSRGTSNDCVREQKSNYLLRKAKLKAIFAICGFRVCLLFMRAEFDNGCSVLYP